MVDYELKDGVIRIDARRWAIEPSIEDSEACMGIVFNILKEVKAPEKLIISEVREREYDYPQLKLLIEIVDAQRKILEEERLLGMEKFGPPECEAFFPGRLTELTFLVTEVLRKDPVKAYFVINRKIKRLQAALERATPAYRRCAAYYLRNVLEPMERALSACQLVAAAKPALPTYRSGDRRIYRELFRPTIRPTFMLSSFKLLVPREARLLDRYEVGKILVEIYRIPGAIRDFYFIIAPEFKLPPEHYSILDIAYRSLVARRPAEEIAEPERAREIFFTMSSDLIRDTASRLGVELAPKEIEELAAILVRYTAGFGVLELLLADERIQDVYINSPIGTAPIYIVHSDFEECETNIIPTPEDAEAWATRFRLYSGRPLDEANPVLDSELTVPGGRARVCAITRPLSPAGLAFSFRRHRERPWTFPLYVKVKMIDPLFAGLMNFIIQGGRSILIAGGRASGKTSLLNALMLEILRKHRIIVAEDTLEINVDLMRRLGYNIERMKTRSVITRVEAEMPAEEAIRTGLRLGESVLIVGEVRGSIRGSEEVIIVENGVIKRVKIRDLEGKDVKSYKVPTLDFDLKMRLKPLAALVKHSKWDRLIKVKTATGREVTITPSHSLFTTTRDFRIAPIVCEKLKVGDQIVIPAKMPSDFNDVNELNLLDLLPEFRLEGYESFLREAIRKIGWKAATKAAGVTSGDIYNYFRAQRVYLPIKFFKNLMAAARVEYSPKEMRIRRGTSSSLPAILPVNKEFCRFLGYYVSEGYYSLKHGNVVITNSDEKIVADVAALGRKIFGLTPYIRETKGKGKSKQINFASVVLAHLISKLGCGRISKEKRIPPLIFGLSREKIAEFLKGLYSGDGSFSERDNAVEYSTTSKLLAEDLLLLLLAFGIVARIRKIPKKKPNHLLWKVVFKDRKAVEIFLNEIGFVQRQPKIQKKAWPHTQANTIHFHKDELRKHLKKYPRKYRHLFRFERCSKNYLEKVINDKGCIVSKQLKTFAEGDFFLDRVITIEEIKLNSSEYVYDLSVNPTQNFVGGVGGILLHNTEALTLFEAMRIGALANVVAGTVHAESPYGVFDRIVHDLGVPPTSFKACDLIVICSMLRSPDGLHRFRRVVELTELRKAWREDPEAEGGFVPLMQYSAKEDRLKPTDVLLDGESWVLNEIAKRVREWRGAWDLVWDNILLRAKIREAMVDLALKLNRPEILEADWTVEANERFHVISEQVLAEVGSLDSKMIYERWLEWLKGRLR